MGRGNSQPISEVLSLGLEQLHDQVLELEARRDEILGDIGLHADIKVLRKEREEIKEEIKSLQDSEKAYRESYKKQVEADIEKSLGPARNALGVIKSEIRKKSEILDELNKGIDGGKEIERKLKASLKDLKHRIETDKAEFAQCLKNEKDNLNKIKKEFNIKLKNFNLKLKEFNLNNNKLHNREINLHREIKDFKESVSVKQKELSDKSDVLHSLSERLRVEREELRQERLSLKSTYDEKSMSYYEGLDYVKRETERLENLKENLDKSKVGLEKEYDNLELNWKSQRKSIADFELKKRRFMAAVKKKEKELGVKWPKTK